MGLPGYQAPVMKASRCGNERQERSDRRKAGRKGSWLVYQELNCQVNFVPNKENPNCLGSARFCSSCQIVKALFYPAQKNGDFLPNKSPNFGPIGLLNESLDLIESDCWLFSELK